LLEIVIALAIVAVAVLAVSTAMSGHTRASAGLEQRMIASWVASNELSLLRHQAKTERIKTGRRSDTVEMGGRRWRATSRIEETEVERVFLVTVTVRDEEDRDGAVIATLTSAVSDSF
jgi:general secretion pathway protein I